MTVQNSSIPAAAAAVMTSSSSSSDPASAFSPSPRRIAECCNQNLGALDPHDVPIARSVHVQGSQTRENPVETGWYIRSEMQIPPAITSEWQESLPRPPGYRSQRNINNHTHVYYPPSRSEDPAPDPAPDATADDADEHAHTAELLTEALTDPTLSPDQRMILQLTRAIALAACHATIPSSLATAAISAGNRVWAASRGPRLLEIVERVQLVELCKIGFLMPVIARFFEDVCCVVVLVEAEEGDDVDEAEVEEVVLRKVIRFNRVVGEGIEEQVGTEEFERVCAEMGVWEESDDEDFEDGGGCVCGGECEEGRGGDSAGAVEDEETDDDDDGDHVSGAIPENDAGEDDGDDDGSDFCSNPFEEEEDDGDTERPTVFWSTIAAPGEDHRDLIERAMREVNERLTIIEHVIGRAIRSVAMKCDGTPATQFYTFYIPATRSILSDLAAEVSREIFKARARCARPERAVPDTTSLDPYRFDLLRRIFLGDHPELASTMQDSILDKEHRRNTMHVFWQNAVIEQRLSEEELGEFCERLTEKETFDEISEYIPTLQMDQSHNEFLNPTINRIMIATRDLRPPAPIPGQTTLKDYGFLPKKASETTPGPGQGTMPATPSQRNVIAAEILNLFEKSGINDRTPTEKATKDLLGKMSPQAFATIMDEAIKPISGLAMKQSEIFIDGIYYAWTKGFISISALHSLKGEGALQDFLTSCAEEMSKEVLDLGDAPISMQEYMEMRNRGSFGNLPGDRTRKKSKKQGRPTKVEGIAEIPVKKPIGYSEKPKSAPALPSTSQSIEWKPNTVMDLDLLDLLIGLILRALGSSIHDVLEAHKKAKKPKPEQGESSTVTADRDDEFRNKEISRISNLMTTLAGYVRQYNGGYVNKGAMMATHAEMKAILKKLLAGSNKADVVRALERSDLLRLSDVKTPEELVAYFVTPVPESSLAGVKAVSNPINKVATPKIPISPEKRVQDATNEEERLLIEIRDMFREYHAAGLGFEQDSTMGLATERPLSFLEDFQKARSKHLAQKLADGRLAKKQQREDLVKSTKGVSREEMAAHKHNKSELTRRMLKITQNMLPYFSTKKFSAQDLSKCLMDSIETLSCDDLKNACTIIDQNMPKALKADGKPSLANLRACANEFDAMMEKVCSVVMPCKCKCKHDHGPSKGKQVRNGRR